MVSLNSGVVGLYSVIHTHLSRGLETAGQKFLVNSWLKYLVLMYFNKEDVFQVGEIHHLVVCGVRV